MQLRCGCVDTCKGHGAVSNPAAVEVKPGAVHIPSLLEVGARWFTGLFEQKAGLPAGRIYDNGLGHFVKAALNEHPDIPQTPLTAGDLLRRAGLLPEQRGKR
jgi:hypothetical protein